MLLKEATGLHIAWLFRQTFDLGTVMKQVHYDECFINSVNSDGLVLEQQGISNYSAECKPMRHRASMS